MDGYLKTEKTTAKNVKTMIYVDSLSPCVPNKNWRWKESSHLIADTEEELHSFALKIGLKREWFQNHSRLPHYDLTANRRKIAVEHGAIEINRRTLVEFMRKYRNESSNK